MANTEKELCRLRNMLIELMDDELKKSMKCREKGNEKDADLHIDFFLALDEIFMQPLSDFLN